jgi:transposase
MLVDRGHDADIIRKNLKNARRIAIRYNKTAASDRGFIGIASIRLWVCNLSV